MNGFYVSTFIFLIGFSSLHSQLQNNVTDFKISTDNSPSTIIQSNPKMFCNGTKGFLVVWEDNRWGNTGYAAQYFDSLGNPVGKNFRMLSNEGITFSVNNKFIAVERQYYYSYYFGDELEISARIYDLNGNYGNTFVVGGGKLNCDVCCTGIDVQTISNQDYLQFFSRDEGRVSSTKYDFQGNILSYSSEYEKYPYNAGCLSAAENKKSKVILAQFNEYEYNYDNDSMSLGIYINMYDEKDSLIIKNLLVEKFPTDYGGCYYTYENTPIVKALCISDSLFELFWLNKDSSSISFTTINDEGIILSEITTLPITYNKPTNGQTEFRDIYLSSIDKNGFAAAIVVRKQNNFEYNNHYYNTLYYFDASGNYVRTTFDSTTFFNFSEQFFKISDSTFYIASQKNDDVYLTTITGFTTEASRKINDDEVGSNEINPKIISYDNLNNFITWDNEINSVGQKISLDGKLNEKPVLLKGSKVIFNNEGNCFNIWKKNINPDSAQLGFSIYNTNWELLKEEIVPLKRDYYSIDASILKLSDSIFILQISDWLWPNYNYTIRTLNNDFEKINEINIYGEQYYSLKQFRENDNSFWLSLPNSLQLYSTDFKPLSITYKVSPRLYLGNNKFLGTYDIYSQPPYYSNFSTYGCIYTINGDTLTKKFYISRNTYDLRIENLPNKDFLKIWSNNNNLYARAFSPEGKAKTDSFLIHSSIQSLKKQPSVAVNGDKVFFVWSDARNEGRGYDIYGSIFDLFKVVEVKEDKQIELPTQFVLFQNYPNPFNPVTKIKFQIPYVRTSPMKFVQLKIYDILGNEVATLVNEVKPAGTYEVEFYANNLSSGVYFYQLQAGSFVETKKFIILK